MHGAKPFKGRDLPPEDAAPEAAPAPLPIRLHAPPPAPRPKEPPPALGHGTTPGVDKRTAERMKRGRMEIDGRIDLHGMSQDAAHAALASFVARGYEDGRRCVLVITGKGLRQGSGILRASVPRWLNEPGFRERVLGFSYAQPRDGGEGALYVLLKRKR